MSFEQAKQGAKLLAFVLWNTTGSDFYNVAGEFLIWAVWALRDNIHEIAIWKSEMSCELFLREVFSGSLYVSTREIQGVWTVEWTVHTSSIFKLFIFYFKFIL